MYRKNTAGTITFAMIDAATGAGTAGLTVTGVRSIDGGAQASVTGVITSLGGGQYKFAAAAGDLNGNNIGFLFTATGMIPVNVNVTTINADLTDGVRLGLTALPNAAAAANGGLPTTNGTKLNQTADLTAGQTIAATIAAGAIATDAITAAAVKADAVIKIQNGLATEANLATVDTVVDAIKAKTDNLPASPAAVGSAMTLTAAYDKAKDDVLTPLAVVDGIVDAIKLKTDLIVSGGATEANVDAVEAKVDAIKAKTDSLTFDIAGKVSANIKAIEGQLTDGNNATLKLKTIDIANPSGSALSLFGDFGLQIGGLTRGISVIGFDGVGVYVQGDSNDPTSNTPGLQIIGGTTGKDIDAKELDAIIDDVVGIKGNTWDSGSDTLEAIRDRIDDVMVSTGTPIGYAPTAAVRTIGDDEGGTVTDLSAHDDSYMQTGENATTGLEVDVTRDVSTVTEIPSVLRVVGFYSGISTHRIIVSCYNYLTEAYEEKGVMINRTEAFEYSFPLSNANHDAATGEMKVKFKHEVTTYNATHFLRLDFVSWEKVEGNSQIASDLASIKAKTDQTQFNDGFILAKNESGNKIAEDSTVSKSTGVKGTDAIYDKAIDIETDTQNIQSITSSVALGVDSISGDMSTVRDDIQEIQDALIVLQAAVESTVGMDKTVLRDNLRLIMDKLDTTKTNQIIDA